MLRRSGNCDQPRPLIALPSLSLIWVMLTATAPLAAQTQDDPLPEWLSATSSPLPSLEQGVLFADVPDLRSLVGSARLVALGEAVHGAHEFLVLRNQLLEFLVEELGFTAIAVETGFTEALSVDEYVRGGKASGPVAQYVFSSTAPKIWSENNRLIEWIRDYNARPSTSRKVRFYGFDLSGGNRGMFRDSRVSADSALAYLERVDSALADRARRDLQAFLPQSNKTDYAALDANQRNALTAGLGDLVGIFEREKPTFVALTSEPEYEVAYRQALDVQKVDALFRIETAAPDDAREAINVRDHMMASNVEWIMEREGDDGRVLLFAHNGHVRASPEWPDAYQDLIPMSRAYTPMGEYLRLRFGEKMVVIGTAFGGGSGDWEGFQRADPRSVDGLLGAVGAPASLFWLRRPDTPAWIRQAMARFRRVRVNNRYGEVDVLSAFDAIVYVDSLTPVQEVPGGR